MLGSYWGTTGCGTAGELLGNCWGDLPGICRGCAGCMYYICIHVHIYIYIYIHYTTFFYMHRMYFAMFCYICYTLTHLRLTTPCLLIWKM